MPMEWMNEWMWYYNRLFDVEKSNICFYRKCTILVIWWASSVISVMSCLARRLYSALPQESGMARCQSAIVSIHLSHSLRTENFLPVNYA
jgi:hypothetical protein